jgi:Tfp pilus assembly protein PilF
MILSSLTGSPLGSAFFLIILWFVVDRFTLGVLPDPFRWLMRRRRAAALERSLRHNPHDRRARLELAELYLQRKLGRQAVDVLRSNLEHGDDDIQTVFTMGAACCLAGHDEQGEKLLRHAQEIDRDFRVGEIDLVLGEARLARGDFAGAKTALESFVKERKGTVQGRVLLARAVAAEGDDGAAALLRDEAWDEYASSPGFQRRKDRFWAWRARPSRPLIYAAILLAALALFASVVAPAISSWASRSKVHQTSGSPDDWE